MHARVVVVVVVTLHYAPAVYHGAVDLRSSWPHRRPSK